MTMQHGRRVLSARALLLALWLACIAAAAPAQTPAQTPDPGTTDAAQVLVLLSVPAQHFRPDGNYAGGYSDAAGRMARRRIAAQLAREHGLAVVTDWPLPLLGLDCYVMSVPPDRSADEIASSLTRDARVAWAQRMNSYQAQSHDDPLFGLQPAAVEWQLASLHDSAQGRGVRVAVIDSAIDRSHPDLVARVEASEDYVTAHPSAAENHGTAVAGIIAATADNGLGIAGIAPQAQLLALRACWQAPDDATRCNTLSLAQAIDTAIAHHAQVINLSLSGPTDRLLGRLIDTALARGIAVVAAVDRSVPDGGFPAAQRGVIAVSDTATGAPQDATRVVAPGRDVPTTVTGGRWALVSGSSYAAAHVSGLLALLGEARERRGRASSSALRAFDALDLVRRPDGRVDACASLARIAGGCGCSCTAAVAAPAVAGR